MVCKGICIRHKAMKPVATGRYSIGQKRCQVCQIFLKWDGLWCPCCGYRLRSSPRNSKFKAELRARKEIDKAKTSPPPKHTVQLRIQAHQKHIAHKKRFKFWLCRGELNPNIAFRIIIFSQSYHHGKRLCFLIWRVHWSLHSLHSLHT